MKKYREKLEDISCFLESSVRIAFYYGVGIYLAWKATIVIPQHPDIPDILTWPAVLIALLGGVILHNKIVSEPTPKERRAAKRRADLLEEWIKEVEERGK